MDGIADPGLLAEPIDVFAFEADHPPVKMAKRPSPGRGVFFDPHIDLREPEVGRLTEWLVERFDRARNKQRLRDREVWRHRLRKLAANAMRAHFFRDSPAVLYSRGAAAEWYQDKPDWMQHGVLADVVDPLIAVGVLDGIIGKKMPRGLKSWAASYWATDDLIRMALDCGVTAASIVPDVPEEELVQLFAPKPKPEYDRLKGELFQPRKGKRIRFDPTPQTQQWAATLAEINAFYRQQEIGLGLTPAEQEAWLAERNVDPEQTGPPYRLPELFSTDLYRVFNNGDEAKPEFGKGGRLFGGWWMYVPEKLRKAITINGNPTVELDYAECHPRMLYHQRDLPGDGELYNVPEITAYEDATGVERDTYRPCIKWLVQILINGRGRPEAVEPPDEMLFLPDIPIQQIVRFIEKMHQPIADAFKTGAGLGLMRLESDIALEIVATAMAEGWTVLSVHDSFITTIDQRDRLKAMMIDAYVRRLGREPKFKDEKEKIEGISVN